MQAFWFFLTFNAPRFANLEKVVFDQEKQVIFDHDKKVANQVKWKDIQGVPHLYGLH